VERETAISLMKTSLLYAVGIVVMVVLGYLSAFYAQDLVWLLVPGLVIAIMLFSFGKIFR
jgi:hypothetical protein